MIGLEFCIIIIILLSFCRLSCNLPAAAARGKGVRNVYLRLLFFLKFFFYFLIRLFYYIVGPVLGEVTLF